MRNAFLSLFMGFLGILIGLGISLIVWSKLGVILPLM